MAGLSGAPVVLLTSTVTSPSTKQIIGEFLAKYPGSRHIQYDAISYSGLLLANEAGYGKRAIPSYQLENARVVVSLGADFLGTWLNPVEFQRTYATGRKISGNNIDMSKHYQFESMMSMTGASADERFTHKPSETGSVAVALLNALNGQAVSGISNEKLRRAIDKVSKDLLANKGRSLVLCGSNNPNIQGIVNAINEAIGANGTTINWALPLQTKQGIDSDMAGLIADMDAGRIGALLVYDANPAYDYYNADMFKAALKKVKLSVSFNEKKCETSELCKFLIPSHHFLESWGDAEVKPGYISMAQPTIAPLFKTRQFQDSLLKWSGNQTPYSVYFKQFWTARLGSEALYNKALQDGIVEPAETPAMVGSAFNAANLASITAAIYSIKKGGARELVLYQNIAMGDGKQANNPWLLELPDPITKATWENFIMVSPALGKELFKIDITDRRQADEYEVHPNKPW